VLSAQDQCIDVYLKDLNKMPLVLLVTLSLASTKIAEQSSFCWVL